MRLPAVTVLMPAYNAEASLSRALATIQRQTFQDWELVLIDDGSTDRTSGIAQTAAKLDARIRVVALPHQGIVAALNAGLATARAPLIARMDADDEAHPDRLAEQVAFLADHPDVGMVGSLVSFGGNAAIAAGYALHVEWLNTVISAEDIQLNQFVESPFAHPSVMFRAGLVHDHGGYAQGDFPEDYELWLRWLAAGVQMAKTPRSLLTWHDLPHRLSRRDSRYSLDAFYRCKAVYLARWLRSRLTPARPLLVWGAGRLTRRRAELLIAHGVAVAGYIDIDPRKIGRVHDHRPVLSPDQIGAPASCFVLGYVAKRGARELARQYLCGHGFQEGRDFLMAA